MDSLAIVSTIASMATAIGVGLAGWQLRLTQRQAVLQFEDQLAGEYRALIKRLPIEALLGEELTDEKHSEALPAFLHYFDLSNEQAFLHRKGRISKATWENWREGIEQNLARPAFARAWGEVSRRASGSFDDLRSIVPPAGQPANNSNYLPHPDAA